MMTARFTGFEVADKVSANMPDNVLDNVPDNILNNAPDNTPDNLANDLPAGLAPGNQRRAVLLLALLVYLSSGALLGFIQTGWPLLLQRQGVAIEWVSLAMVLVLPFGFAALWAPLVDRYWLAALGRRRSWILLAQMLVVLLLAVAVLFAGHVRVLAVCLALCSVCAATLDVALDALLIASCAGEKQLAIRGPLKLGGMLAGGLAGSTLSVWLYSHFSMRGSVLLLLGLALLAAVFIGFWREAAADVGRVRGWFDFRRFFMQPGSRRMVFMAVVMVALIEMGLETMRLFLVSQHIPLTRLSVLFGPLAAIAGIFGALAGGYAGQRVGLVKVIIGCGVLLGLLFGVLSVSARWIASVWIATVLWMSVAGFIYAMLSASVFSFSMLWCRRSSHLASDFASVQCAWVLGGIVGAALSGRWLSLAGSALAFASVMLCLLLACLITPAAPGDDGVSVMPETKTENE